MPTTCERHERTHALSRQAVEPTLELGAERGWRGQVKCLVQGGRGPGFAPLALLHIVRIHVRHVSVTDEAVLSSGSRRKQRRKRPE